MPASRNQRVYSRPRQNIQILSPSSSKTNLSSSPPRAASTKRPLSDYDSALNSPPRKKISLSTITKALRPIKLSKKSIAAQATFTQLQLIPDKPLLRECKLCGLSYTRAAVEDERVHRQHCIRVRKGMEWGREEERALGPGQLTEVVKGVRLKDGKFGRIISLRADVTGKIQLAVLLDTVNLALSSPPLTPDALRASKVYLFLLPTSNSSRESIVGAVIAQRISTAMAIASPNTSTPESDLIPVHIDSTKSLRLDPTPLPTPLGISRLFVSSSFRRQGIAFHMLDATASTFIHGCPLDPSSGDVAFSQPTALGQSVMERWGSGGCRIYEE
jgi:N-acetyltransferase